MENHEISPEDFHARSLATLRRGVPSELEWLKMAHVPPLSWSADGQPVDPIVPKGWLVDAHLRGLPQPDAALRAEAQRFATESLRRLATWLFNAWAANDTYVPELTPERHAELRVIAERGSEVAERWGRKGTDADERLRRLVEREQAQRPPAAPQSVGLLAVVASCGGRAVAAEAERFVAQWSQDRPRSAAAVAAMVEAMSAL